MKTKKSLSLKSWAFGFSLLISMETIFAKDIDPSIREQVIQDLAAESRQDFLDYQADPFAPKAEKVILKGYWDAKARNLVFQRSTKKKLEDELKISMLSLTEKGAFINARNLALASLSAGGILYFIPQKNLIFWETDEEEVPESLSGEKFWTNPVIGNLLSGFLSHVQEELKQTDTKSLGSSALKSFMMIILNPAAALAKQVNKFRAHKITQGHTQIITEFPITPDADKSLDAPPQTNYIGLHFTFHF